MSPLEQRLAQVEARLALQELLGRYALAVDDHDAAGLAACFTEDGVFASPNSPPDQGRAAVVAAFERRFATYGATLHLPHVQVLHELGDRTARGTVVGTAQLAAGDDTVVTAIRYEDDYRCEQGRWHFASRVVRTLYALPARDLVAGGLSWPLRKRWPGTEPSAAELPDQA